ncbi:MAG: 50S ribosome-binding GTPase [Planctomycetaceae bacterium]|nr:50S ribosome-binding GTPase [Planctomycetaceae bacterium]
MNCDTGVNFSFDTIVARASASGSSFRSIIRMSGNNSLLALREIFEPIPFSSNSPYILDGDLILWGERRKIPSTLYYWSSGRGYTGEESVEVHTIGSPPVYESFIEFVCGSGLVRLARPGEFTMRAFLNGRIDLTQAEAVLGVIDAGSKASLQFALQQLAGGVAAPLAELRENLLDVLVQLEAGFDFVDEDIEFISGGEIRRAVAAAMEEISRLRGRLGLRAIEGERPKITLAGAPNAGKSSLFNYLSRKNMAIVSDQAGTTRDYLEAEINFGGVECILIDTAGITNNFCNDNNNFCNNNNSVVNNNSGDNIDEFAQDYSRKMIELSDVIILCIASDIFVTNNPISDNLVSDNLASRISVELFGCDISDRLAVVCTKCDLLEVGLLAELRRAFGGNIIFVSLVEEYGVDDLRNKIAAKLSTANNTIISTASRCREAINCAYNSLNNVINLQIQDEALIAAEIRAAINSLGLIDGTIHTEDILDRIFERFCIGK